MNIIYKITFISFFLGLFLFQIIQAQDSKDILFSIVDDPASEWAAKQVEDIKRAEIQLNEQTLQKIANREIDEFEIENFEGQTYRITVRRVIKQLHGDWSVTGYLNSDIRNSFTLSYSQGTVLSSIQNFEAHKFYDIKYSSEVMQHYFLKVDPHERDELSCGIDHDMEVDSDLGQKLQYNNIIEDQGEAVIDVMIVYTPAARSWATLNSGGIQNVINQSMAVAQNTVDNADVNLEFRLVHSAEVDYVESGDSGTDLCRLTATETYTPNRTLCQPTSILNEVHHLRDLYQADLVAMFTLADDVGGIAWLLRNPEGNSNIGFSLTRVQQATGTTHVHEMGHNMGMAHSRLQSVNAAGDRGGLFTYSTGWRWNGQDGNSYSSVMTYRERSEGVQIFSNPDITFQGVPTGSYSEPGAPADNARSLREIKHVISAYRGITDETYSISGQVVDEDGSEISGLPMILTRHDQNSNISVTTDGSGFYRFLNLPAGQDYTVAPQSEDDFEPPSNRFNNLSSNQTQNFQRIIIHEDIVLDFGANITNRVGDEISIPVSTSDLTGLGITNFDFSFLFDDSLIEFTAVDIEPGSLISSLTANQTSDNSILVSYDSSSSIEGGGVLFTIHGSAIGGGTNEEGFIVSEVLMGDGSASIFPLIPFNLSVDIIEYQPPTVVIVSGPEDGSTIEFNDPDFVWEVKIEDGEVVLYEVELNGLNPKAFSTEVTYHQFEDLENGEYEFQVRAQDNYGAFSEWAQRSFTVDVTPTPLPEAPNLVAPADGGNGVDPKPDFVWTQTEHADSYELQLSEASGFDELILEQSGLTETIYSVEDALNYETEYFFRIRGVNQTGAGEWSEVWSFSTIERPTIDGLTIVDVDGGVELVWNLDDVYDIDQFNIYRGTSPGELNLFSSTSEGTRFFLFQNIPDGVSFYAVTYVTTTGAESELSNIVSYMNSSQTISGQWQLLSLPVNDAKFELENSTVYHFDRFYRSNTILKPGKGYWIRGSSSSSDDTYSLRGEGITELSIDLNEGWNLIGSITGDVSVSSIIDPDNILTTAPVFGYEGTNRVEVTKLETGKGYWLYASDEGEISINLNQSSGKEQHARLAAGSVNTAGFEPGKIIFSKNEAEQIIRISGHRPDDAQMYRYILPPPAPQPLLDVRTRSGFSLMYGISEELVIRAADFPVGVRAESNPGDHQIYRIIATDNDGSEIHYNLLPDNQIYIEREYESFRLEKVELDEAILEAGIDPNYPNPFNPATNIRYRLAESSYVRIDVFDAAGRRVTTLVNSRQMPGQHTVQFDGSSLASGVYFLRIQAGSFVDVQKLTLIK